MSGTPRTKSTKKSTKLTKTTNNKFGLNKLTVKRAIILLAVALALFGIWELGRQGGSWGESDTLRIVKAEKLADKKLLGLELVSTKLYGENGLVIIERLVPSVKNTFKPEDGDMDKTLKQIIAFAEADGWVRDDNISDEDRWIGRKPPRKNIELVVDIQKYAGNIVIEVSGYENR